VKKKSKKICKNVMSSQEKLTVKVANKEDMVVKEIRAIQITQLCTGKIRNML
jgi:hypothetical protein